MQPPSRDTRYKSREFVEPTQMMTLHQSDRERLHLQKGDPRRHPEAVAKREREASPLHHRRRNATRDASCPDRHQRHHQLRQERRRLLEPRRRDESKYAESAPVNIFETENGYGRRVQIWDKTTNLQCPKSDRQKSCDLRSLSIHFH